MSPHSQRCHTPVWPYRIWQWDVASSNTFSWGLLVATTMWESPGPRNFTSRTSSLYPASWNGNSARGKRQLKEKVGMAGFHLILGAISTPRKDFWLSLFCFLVSVLVSGQNSPKPVKFPGTMEQFQNRLEPRAPLAKLFQKQS